MTTPASKRELRVPMDAELEKMAAILPALALLLAVAYGFFKWRSLRTRREHLAALGDGQAPLAEWRFDEDEWAAFHRRLERNPIFKGSSALVFGACGPAALYLGVGDLLLTGPYWFLGLTVALALAAIPPILILRKYQRAVRGPRRVRVFRTGLEIGSERHVWGVPGLELSRVEVTRERFGWCLVITYAAIFRRQAPQVIAPIERGKEESARSIIDSMYS